MADRASFLAPAADKPWYVDFSTPPSRSKRFGYRVWFGLILLMESAIGRKQVAKLASFAPELAAEFRTYTFVQMGLHVLFDLLALALLNALHPRVGVRVDGGAQRIGGPGANDDDATTQEIEDVARRRRERDVVDEAHLDQAPRDAGSEQRGQGSRHEHVVALERTHALERAPALGPMRERACACARAHSRLRAQARTRSQAR